MKIVAETSDAELKIRQAQQRVEWALVDLSANLIRVVRGAGKPYDLIREASEFLKAAAAYYEVKGEPPFDPFQQSVLSVQREASAERFGQAEAQRAKGIDSVIRGALQMSASRLLGQSTQEAAGRSELYQGIRDIEDAREMEFEARSLGTASRTRTAGVVMAPAVEAASASQRVRRGRPRKNI